MNSRYPEAARLLEYIEDDFAAPEVAEADTTLAATEAAMLEVDDEQEDDDTVSSDETEIDVSNAEAPAYGTEGAYAVESSLELEPVEGFDASVLEMDREDIMERVDESRLLDAWYAEFDDPALAAFVSQQPYLTERGPEVVIGEDDRVRINNTTTYPWRTICSLLITAKDGSRWIGTGWLVGPRTVITAGHVVYIHNRGGWVKSIEVIPGRNGASRPYGSCVATNFRSVKGWTKNNKRSHDYGAIILPKDCRFGDRVGYFGYANLNLTSLLNLKVNLSGYPGDKETGTQWWHARRVKLVTARTLVYNIDTAGGQSGSPVWRLKDGKRHVVGIHTNGASSGNSATRITKPVFDNIKKWKAEGA